jgi:hypothetical protein
VNPNNPGTATVGVGGGFNPALLSSVPDQFGNILGNPGFVNPRDARPGFDGPANFLLDANYDLAVTSDAIDNGLNSAAPPLDFLYRSRVKIPGRGHAGPADIGAFEFNGQFGISGHSGSSSGNSGSGGIARSFAAVGSLGSNSGSGTSSGSTNATDQVLGTSGQDVSKPAVSNGLTFATQTTAAPAPTVSQTTTPAAQTTVVNQGSGAQGHATTHTHVAAHAHVAPRRGFNWRSLLRKHSARG